MERLSVVMLIALVLGFAEATLMHHHSLRMGPDTALAVTADDANAPAKGRSANHPHVCALCVVGLQGSEAPAPTRWDYFSPTASPLAHPPAVLSLATSTFSHARRGPPAV
ncbi:MAG: hypothetical protein MUE68_00525 [Bacteroidetes bacterium]|jgi:hypothetical protein|nr:hypothetical protein [Bacteroidota bacterium]